MNKNLNITQIKDVDSIIAIETLLHQSLEGRDNWWEEKDGVFSLYEEVGAGTHTMTIKIRDLSIREVKKIKALELLLDEMKSHSK